MRSGSALVTDTIGDLSPRPTMPRRRDTSEPAAPISCSSASSSASRGALGLERLARRRRPVSDRPSRPAGCRPDPGPGASARGWRPSGSAGCPGPEIAAVVSCLAVGSGSSAASARTHCIGSKPIGRTTTSSRATGSSSSCGLADELAQLGLDAGRADQFLEVLQPVAALTTERHGVRLTGVEADRRGREHWAEVGLPTLSVAAGGHPVVFVDRHVLLSPRCASRAYRCRTRRLRLSSCGAWTSRPCGGPVIRRRIPTGFGTSAIRIGRRPDVSPGPPRGQSSPTKSVIRASTIFAPQMVTGEFYARVTTRWITAAPTRAEASGTNVLHAGGYGRVAITAQIKAVLLSNRYVNISPLSTSARGRACKGDNLRRIVFVERRAPAN